MLSVAQGPAEVLRSDLTMQLAFETVAALIPGSVSRVFGFSTHSSALQPSKLDQTLVVGALPRVNVDALLFISAL